MIRFESFFYLVLLFVGHAVCAQHANPDILVTMDNRKLEVEVRRVTQDSVEFVRWNDVEKLSQTEPKTKISSILYGDGRIETFGEAHSHSSQESYLPLFDDDPKPPKPKIEELPTTELKTQYHLFTQKATKYKNMAIVGFVAGAAFTFVGSTIITNAEGLDLGSIMTGVILIGAGVGGGGALTISGTLSGINYSRKKKRASQELLRRNEPLTRLRISPGYNSTSQAGYLSVKLTF